MDEGIERFGERGAEEIPGVVGGYAFRRVLREEGVEHALGKGNGEADGKGFGEGHGVTSRTIRALSMVLPL